MQKKKKYYVFRIQTVYIQPSSELGLLLLLVRIVEGATIR
jgi:hypothetical protein